MDFENMTGPQLVAAWNEMVLTAIDLGLTDVKPVKKFADAKTAKVRCQKLDARIQALKTHDVTELPTFLKREPETPEQEEKRRKKNAKLLNKDESSGLKVIEPTITPEKIRKAIAKDLKDDSKLIVEHVTTKEPAVRKAKAKSNGRMSNDAKITKLVKEYPTERTNTVAYRLFGKIKSGMTVAAWKEMAKQHAGNYLRWYIEHDYVKVTE